MCTWLVLHCKAIQWLLPQFGVTALKPVKRRQGFSYHGVIFQYKCQQSTKENKVLVLWKQFNCTDALKKTSVTQRSSDYSCSVAAGLKCGNGMRRPGGYHAGGERTQGVWEPKVSVGACRRHEQSARKWCWKKRWETLQTRQGLPCCSGFRMHPRGLPALNSSSSAPGAVNSLLLAALCRTGQHKTSWPVLSWPLLPPSSTQGSEKKCEGIRYLTMGITSTLLA